MTAGPRGPATWRRRTERRLSPVLHVGLSIAGLIVAGTSDAQTAARPRPLPPAPVTDRYFGEEVTDPFRYFEAQDATLIDWMKAEGRHTRAVLDSIPNHAALLADVGTFTASFDSVHSFQRTGDRFFYLERAAGSDNYDLMTRDRTGAIRKLIDVAALRAAHGAVPYAIHSFIASPAGDKVAVTISAGGSEDASVTVYDVASGRASSATLPGAQYGPSGWSDDGRTLYLNLLAKLPAGAGPTERYRNSAVHAWNLKSPPVPLFGGRVASSIPVPAPVFPMVQTFHGSPIALGVLINGVENERTFYTAPAAIAATPGAAWTKLAGAADAVTVVEGSGTRLYLLSHKNAPTFQVLTLDAGQPISAARVLVAAQPGRLIEAIGAAADGLYLLSRRGLYSEVTRVPLAGGPEQPVPLPIRGSASDLVTDQLYPGFTATLMGWTAPQTEYSYDPAAGRFAKLDIGTSPPSFRSGDYVATETFATARDGTRVPLSIVTRRDQRGARPVLLQAYGAYGVSSFPFFIASYTLGLDRGMALAVCHVRGGGEFGEAWRLGGKDANKPNTWRDLIACGDALIAQGYTTKKKLVISGGSAGGIAVGRAMEERPDLFAGVLDDVPVANPLRAEFSPNGVPNIPEFGTATTEPGFHNLLAMDSYLNVKDGVAYPPIMIATGLNDPRVASWQPAKLAARLMASDNRDSVLLRVDEQAGHGLGNTKTQTDLQRADFLSFVLWHAGEPGWQPTISVK